MLARRSPLKNKRPGLKRFGDFSFGAANDKYVWTSHSRVKMRQYGLSESRVKRIIRFPARHEEGIVPKCIAVMQPAGTQKYSEIWAMYKLVDGGQRANPGSKTLNPKQRLKIITAWRYPGVSPKRDPIPSEVLQEIRELI
ncbi:hypothetical protein M1432_02075 [Patescibacteria group bacterium]|nr:hypothetical protein [Patescibacteria group bacterium]